MSDWQEYKCLDFSGTLLLPSFSVYLFEVQKEGIKYFYIGMTGDNHYQSARSALHRLAGHIDLSRESKQNQFLIGLKSIFNKMPKDDLIKEELELLTIKMHHWPIRGFVKSKLGSKDLDKNGKDYISYKAIQQEVLGLEQFLITDLKNKLNDRCWNKSKSQGQLKERYKIIYNQILSIINE